MIRIPPDGVDNGSAAVSHKTAARGTTVTITVKPGGGYQLGALTATDAKGNALKLTDKGGGKYTFTMPASKVTVSAAFVKANGGYAGCPQDETCPIWPFADAGTTAWYHDGVHFCLDNGLMGGYGSGRFGPNNTLSRAMLAQILYNNEGRPAVSGRSVFADVAEDAWYADAVIWASANGIVGGYGNGEFGPGDPITREQLAVMLYRYAQRKGGGFTGMWMFRLDFADASAVSEYAYEAMCWCNMNGVVNGCGDKTLRPKNTATRAQAAQMLKNFMENT